MANKIYKNKKFLDVCFEVNRKNTFNLSFSTLVFARKIINALMKWLENTVKICLCHRCHGNIDFHKMSATLKFNPKPTSIANFTLIRQDEDCLRADFKSEVWSQKTVSKHLKDP